MRDSSITPRRREEWQQALDTLRECAAAGHKPDKISYTCVVQACAKGGQSELALELFDEMMARRFEPRTTYRTDQHMSL